MEISQNFVAFSKYMNFIITVFTFGIFSWRKVLDSVKLIYSEKAIKFCKISTLLLSYVVPVKSKVEISQNFVAFSEYMNFTYKFKIEYYGLPLKNLLYYLLIQ